MTDTGETKTENEDGGLEAAAPPSETAPAPSIEPAAASSPERVAVSAPVPIAVPAAGRRNTLSIVSFVAAIAYFGAAVGIGAAGEKAPLWLAVLPAAAVITGTIARGQTMRNGRGGSLLALAGLVLGYLALALLAFGWALVLLTAHTQT